VGIAFGSTRWHQAQLKRIVLAVSVLTCNGYDSLHQQFVISSKRTRGGLGPPLHCSAKLQVKLDYALVDHCVSYLEESSDVGAID